MPTPRTGVNVTTSGPAAAPVRSNDGSERVTNLPRPGASADTAVCP